MVMTNQFNAENAEIAEKIFAKAALDFSACLAFSAINLLLFL
jgi:hypothetical protein